MEPIVGSGKYTYRVNEEWQQPPEWLERQGVRGLGQFAGPGLLLQPQ